MGSGAEVLHAQVEFTGRVFVGGVVDDNVRETPASGAAAGSTLTASLSWKKPTRSTNFGSDFVLLQVQSVNSYYPTHWNDSRTLTQANGKYVLFVSRGFRLMPFARAEAKNFVHRNLNYRTGSLGLQTSLSAPGGVFVSIDAWRSKVVFGSFHEFNSLADVMSLSVGRNFSMVEFVSLKAMAGNHRYSKNALSPDGLNLDIRQRDHTFGYGCSAELFRWNTLLQLNYLYMIIASNSYGSSLNAHKVDAMILRKLGSGLFLKIYGATEVRTYRDDGFVARDVSTYQLGLDNKAISIEVGKAVSDQYEVKFRLHWYNNQALLKTEYYERTVWVVGIERRL